ncbi:hypothetical protein BSLG_002962 [Batrachochytrium salamandrivorans]|nr:hypothetical protein BSLG_002962 [Batrachochytrium salamandrivorans]
MAHQPQKSAPSVDWPYLDEAQPIPSTTVTALSASAKIIDKLFEPLSDPQQTACEARGSFNTTFSNTDSASTSDKDTDSNDDPLTEFHHDDEHPTLEDRTSINPSMLEFESRLRMAGLRPVGVQSHNSLFRACAEVLLGNEKLYTLIKDDFLAHAMFQDDPEKLKEMHIQEKSQKELDDEIRHGFFKGQQSLQEVTNTIPNIALIESGSASVDVSYMNLYNTRSSAEADVDARLGESQDIDFSHHLQNTDNSELCFKTSKVWDGLDQSGLSKDDSMVSLSSLNAISNARESNTFHLWLEATSVQSDHSALGSSKLLQKILVNGEFSPRLQRSKCDGKPPVSMKPMETAPFVSDVGSFDELPHQRSIITHTANDPKTCLHDDSRDNQGRSEPHVPVVHLTQQYKNEYIESSASRDSNGSENSIDSEEFRQIQTAIENSLIDYRSLDRQGHLYLTDRNVGSSRSFAREENNDDIVSGLEDTSDCDEDLKKALAQSLMEYESSHGRQSMACWESGSGGIGGGWGAATAPL